MEVDRSLAPGWLTYRFSGQAPTPEEQASIRAALIKTGELTDATRALMDLRDLTGNPSEADLTRTIRMAVAAGGQPTKRAYVVLPWMHLAILNVLRDNMPPSMQFAAFIDEADARKWLERLP